MWMPDYQTSFLQILSKYPGLITQTFAAHTHMDEFRIMSPGNVVEITQGITPRSGNNPAFKVFTFSGDTLTATDYTSFNYDLASTPPQFNTYYTFSTAYSLQGLLNGSLTQLDPLLATDSVRQALYRTYYFSGNAFATTSYPITDTNWPVYWCGIGHMDQQGFIDCVNSY